MIKLGTREDRLMSSEGVMKGLSEEAVNLAQEVEECECQEHVAAGCEETCR